MNYKIIPFTKEYTDTLYEMCKTTINELYLPLYPDQVVEYFLSYNQPKHIRKDSKKGYTALFFVDDKLVGSGCLLGTTLKRLFVLPDYHLKGIGTLIVKHLEEKAIENKCKTIDMFAMTYTAYFYQKLGYSELGFSNYTVDKDHTVDYMRMYKDLYLPWNKDDPWKQG